MDFNKKHQHLYGHYLVLDTIKLGEFYNKSQELHNDTQKLTKMYNDNLNRLQYENECSQSSSTHTKLPRHH